MEKFLLLANKLKIKNVIFRYLTIFEYKHFDLSVFFNKKLVNNKFKRVLDLSKNLGINVNLPYSFKKYNTFIQHCCSPWDYFYVENQGNVNKCIFADTHIGNLNKNSRSTLNKFNKNFDKNYRLMNIETGEIYKNNVLIRDTNINNATKLILM